jgi:hypothetical protein
MSQRRHLPVSYNRSCRQRRFPTHPTTLRHPGAPPEPPPPWRGFFLVGWLKRGFWERSLGKSLGELQIPSQYRHGEKNNSRKLPRWMTRAYPRLFLVASASKRVRAQSFSSNLSPADRLHRGMHENAIRDRVLDDRRFSNGAAQLEAFGPKQSRP